MQVKRFREGYSWTRSFNWTGVHVWDPSRRIDLLTEACPPLLCLVVMCPISVSQSWIFSQLTTRSDNLLAMSGEGALAEMCPSCVHALTKYKWTHASVSVSSGLSTEYITLTKSFFWMKKNSLFECFLPFLKSLTRSQFSLCPLLRRSSILLSPCDAEVWNLLYSGCNQKSNFTASASSKCSCAALTNTGRNDQQLFPDYSQTSSIVINCKDVSFISRL